MGLFNTILKTFVGDKAKKDLRLILPTVDAIKKIGVDLEKLTNDELREKTSHFKKKIVAESKEFDNKIEKIKSDLSSSQNIIETQKVEFTKCNKNNTNTITRYTKIKSSNRRVGKTNLVIVT